MRENPLQLSIESDGKHIYIHPLVISVKGRGCFEGPYVKLKYTCSAVALGEGIADSFLYIRKKYENEEEADRSKEYSSVSWRKRASLSVLQYQDGHVLMIPNYTDHEIMTTSSIEYLHYSANSSVNLLGEAAFACLQKSFDYAKRKELAVYFSNKDGLLFVPMALNRTGYVLADYCICVKEPYAPEEICKALKTIKEFLEENPEDTRTNKERKNNLPWRAYTQYKSMHGFVKAHHCVQIHMLIDGSLEFIPNLRRDSYDSHFVVYNSLKAVLDNDSTCTEISEELWKSFEICELIYKKCQEPDPSCHHDIFFSYVDELRKQRNDKYQTEEELEQCPS